MAGWIKLHRDLADHWLWDDKPFSRGQAWVDLLLWARHKPGNALIEGSLFNLDVGQQARSVVTLGKHWGWDRRRVQRFLNRLAGDGMIVQQTNNKTSIITICNYEQLQGSGRPGSDSNGTADGHQTAQQTDIKRYTIEEGEKGNNGNNNPLVASSDATNVYPDAFEELWAAYPKRKGSSKKPTYKAWNARIRGGADAGEILRGVKDYARYCEHHGKMGTEFVKLAQTFLGPGEHYLADWGVSDCPHLAIVDAWNEELPAHIQPVDHDAWSPGATGRARLEESWEILKAKPRSKGDGMVIQDAEQGARWFRAVFRRLAKSPRLLDETSAQWCKLSWAVKNETIHEIAQGAYDQ